MHKIAEVTYTKTSRKVRCPIASLDHKLWSLYRIRLEDRERMRAEQNGKCAICWTETHDLHVDHNHVTNKVRGLLCRKCNTALHAIEDEQFMLLAIAYLRRHGYDFTGGQEELRPPGEADP